MADAVEIVVVASAFGVNAVRADGHLKWAQGAKRAGAAGFEVRRELFASDADADPQRLRALGAALADLGLWSVFSTPASLYAADGQLDTDALRVALDQAAALGARFVKLQLGGFAGEAHGAAIVAHVASGSGTTGGVQPRLVVENGQLAQGGSPAQFVGLFDALAREGHAGVLGMTFDTGNWAWLDVAPLPSRRSSRRTSSTSIARPPRARARGALRARRPRMTRHCARSSTGCRAMCRAASSFPSIRAGSTRMPRVM